MSKQHLTLGFYGKLPTLGDFVSRQLPQEFIASWDSWLQSSIAVSRDVLGEQWLDQYLSSPIWRFALSSGISGKDAWIGIVMPSVDRVGRYFPLTVAGKVPATHSLVQLFAEASDWFEQLESVAITALEDDLTVAEFDQLVKEVVTLDIVAHQSDAQVRDQTEGNNAYYFELGNTQVKTGSIFPGLAAQLLGTHVPWYSLWSTAGDDGINPAVLVVEGMPPFSAYTGMITGDFAQTGWVLQQQKVEQVAEQEPTRAPEVETKNGGDQIQIDPEKVQSIEVKEVQVNNSISATPEQRSLNMAWQSFARTDTGKVRKLNEDAILDRPDLGLWVVADGMGGHQSGDVASRKIIHILNELHISSSLNSTITQVKAALQLVNNELKELAAKNYQQQIIGSTVVALIAGKTHFACLWAGDSRLYRLRDRKLMQLTLDHCNDQEYITDILSLGVNPELKQNNIITRAVGAFEELELDTEVFDIQTGDIFLLSSDGLDKELGFQEIEAVLNDNEYNDSVEILLERVLDKGARDNVSVIVVKIN